MYSMYNDGLGIYFILFFLNIKHDFEIFRGYDPLIPHTRA